jgi:hypothetical protein
MGLSRARASGAATVPSAITVGQWTLTDVPSAGGDTLSININALPPNGGSAITALQYRLNGGVATALTGVGTGSRSITVPATALAQIEIRAVNAIGNGAWSDLKSATPTVAATAPATITVGQWTLADSPSAGGDTLTINLISAPANGGSAITSYEFRRNGGAWSTLPGGTGLGSRNITVLATTLANIELRAVNAIGNAAASDTKSATPTISSGYTARFGAGADQGSGTGAFNTALYTGSTPANGTYGNFTVSGGIITPNGSQTVGTYSVGGWPVQVISGYKAVANQTEWNALTPANIGGKTVLVREAAALSVSTSWNQNSDFNWATILGDGDDPRIDTSSGKDSRKHFVTWGTLSSKRLILDRLRFVTGSAAGAKVGGIYFGSLGGNPSNDLQVLRCAVIASRPDPFGNFTGGVSSFPGGDGIRFVAPVSRVSVRDNYVIGGCGAPATISLDEVTGFAEMIGNWVDMAYLDGINPPASGSANAVLMGGNLVTRPMSAGAADVGDPHADGTQFQGSAHGVVEANAYIIGSSRGEWQSFFAQDGDCALMVRNIVVADLSPNQVSIGDPIGSRIENCTWLPPAGASFPIAGSRGGIRDNLRFRGSLLGTNDIVNCVYRVAASDINAGVTQTGALDVQTWLGLDWDTNFPNWSISGLPTLQNVFQVHAVGVGAAAGKGAAAGINSWGAERSSYVLNVTTPVVSSIAITPAADGFTGTLRTSVGHNNVFYCLVPQAQGNPTWREIKERRVPNGVCYGQVWCSRAAAGTTDLAISGNTASPGTAYKLCAVAENGWSVQSAVTTANFSTTAAGITRVGVGTLVSYNSAADCVMPIPTAINGDYLVAFVCHLDSTREPTTPSGWTKIGNGVAFTSGFPAVEVYGRFRDGSEGSTLTVNTPSGSGQLVGFVAAYRGVSGPGNQATIDAFNVASRATPSLTATAGSCLLHVWAAWGDSQTLPTPGDLIAAGYTPDLNVWLGAENLLSTSGGATATRTATVASVVSWNAMQIELLKA